MVLYVPCEYDVTVEVGDQFKIQGSFEQREVQSISCLKFSNSFRTTVNKEVYSNKYATLSCWYYCIKTSNSGNIFGYGYDHPYNAISLQENYGQFTIERSSGHFDTNYVMNDNTWYHLAVTLNDNIITAYVNGSVVKTILSSMNLNLNGNVAIGGWVDGGYSPNGYITHGRIYNRVLSEKEIQILSKEFEI